MSRRVNWRVTRHAEPFELNLWSLLLWTNQRLYAWSGHTMQDQFSIYNAQHVDFDICISQAMWNSEGADKLRCKASGNSLQSRGGSTCQFHGAYYIRACYMAAACKKFWDWDPSCGFLRQLLHISIACIFHLKLLHVDKLHTPTPH